METIAEVLTKILTVSSPWEIDKVEVHEPTKTVNVFIHFQKGSKFSCPKCDSACSVYDSKYRVYRHLDICDYRCYLNVKIPRVQCKEHGIKVISKHTFGRQNSHFSFKFDALVMQKVREMSVVSISRELGEVDTTLWSVVNHYIKQGINQIDCSSTRRVGVDETSSKKGHNYISIFTDLDTDKVIFVCQGRGEDVFGQFYQSLFDNMGDPNYIKEFSMDMSVSYISGQREYFPNARVFFDRFHIKKGLNKAIDTIRKQEVKSNEELKRTKYIWLKNACNLTENQKEKLSVFLEQSSTNTAKAYKVKTSFDQLWNIQSNAVEPTLKQWIKIATKLSLTPLNTFVKTIENHWVGVINSMTSFVTNAFAEGLNSVIQMIKSRARGYRNINSFINMAYLTGNDFKFNFH